MLLSIWWGVLLESPGPKYEFTVTVDIKIYTGCIFRGRSINIKYAKSTDLKLTALFSIAKTIGNCLTAGICSLAFGLRDDPIFGTEKRDRANAGSGSV